MYGISGVRSTFEQEVEAARLAHGDDTLVTGPTAARIWDMAGRHECDGIHLLTLTPGKARGPGVVTRRSKVIVPADLAKRRAVGVTSWARTFVENSARRDLTDRQLGWILDDGLRRQLVTLDELVATVRRLRPGPGRRPARVRALLDARGVDYQAGASQPEARIAEWLVAAGFPRPRLNVMVHAGGVRWELDGAYAEERVGWDYHSSFVHEGPGGITTEIAHLRPLEGAEPGTLVRMATAHVVEAGAGDDVFLWSTGIPSTARCGRRRRTSSPGSGGG